MRASSRDHDRGPYTRGVPVTVADPDRATLLDLVLVDRDAYWRVFSLDYQAEQFEVFHRSRITRWTHYAGTQTIVGGLLLASAGRKVGPLPADLLLAAGLAGWYVRMDARVGLAAGAQVAALTALARATARRGVGSRPALVALLAAAAAQNVSHAAEPVPPVLTGGGFEPFGVFWERASALERARVVALNAFYLPLEVVSAPRLFPVHVLRLLQRAGWRRDWADDLRSRADAILAGA